MSDLLQDGQTDDAVLLCRTYLNLTTSARQYVKTGDLSACEKALEHRREVAAHLDCLDFSQLAEDKKRLVRSLLERAASAQRGLQADIQSGRDELTEKLQSLRRARRLTDSYHPQAGPKRSAAYDRIG